MSGHHNIKIYTGKDAGICRECMHGEAVKSAYCFKEESYICWNKEGHPLEKTCPGFSQVNKSVKQMSKWPDCHPNYVLYNNWLWPNKLAT